MAMKYGLLPPSEWKLLEPIFAEFNSSLPSPELARIAVAIDSDGNIQGMLVLQPVFHMEPIWLSSEARAEVRYTKLVKVLEDDLDRVREGHAVHFFAFSTPESAVIEEMGRLIGMEVLPWKVMRKVIANKDIEPQKQS